MDLPLLALTFAAGAAVGSFLNVVIYRVPAGLSVVHPRSRCPACERTIPGWHNIPILSWVFLRGRCANCKAPISARYPLVELLTAIVWTAIVARYGPTALALAGLVFASALIATTFIDIDTWEILDEISLPGIVFGCLVRPLVFGGPWYDAFLGACLGGGFLYAIRWAFLRWRGIEGMGLGDVKLLAMEAAFLGTGSVLPIVLFASLSGMLVGIPLLVLRPRSSEAPVATEAAPAPSTGADDEEDEDDWTPPPTAIPFGPFLALGGLAELMLGPLGKWFGLLARW